MTKGRIKIRSYFVFCSWLLALVSLASCGSSESTYKASDVKWQGDSIYFRLVRIDNGTSAGDITTDVYCRNCNLVHTGWEVQLNGQGEAVIYVPESKELLSTWLKVQASGIDTTLVVKQPSPEVAQSRYHLTSPFIGRVMATQLAMLYNNSELDSVIDHIDAGDELNLFREDDYTYEVHHPRYDRPLFLLRSNAVRMF